MTRLVVSVATDAHYQRGQARLMAWLAEHHEPGIGLLSEPAGCPKHADVPYAFKGAALMEASKRADLLLWCDASVLPIRSLEPLWQRIERDGYWIAKNAGWTNYQWTADSAYPDLFQEYYRPAGSGLTGAREDNKKIPHVVATAFGIHTRDIIGVTFLDWYFRLASQTRAFCGPWVNSLRADYDTAPISTQYPAGPCGPPDVLGHRHDQTAASVIAWRLGMRLDESRTFAYAGDENADTIVVADGRYA